MQQGLPIGYLVGCATLTVTEFQTASIINQHSFCHYAITGPSSERYYCGVEKHLVYVGEQRENAVAT